MDGQTASGHLTWAKKKKKKVKKKKKWSRTFGSAGTNQPKCLPCMFRACYS